MSTPAWMYGDMSWPFYGQAFGEAEVNEEDADPAELVNRADIHTAVAAILEDLQHTGAAPQTLISFRQDHRALKETVTCFFATMHYNHPSLIFFFFFKWTHQFARCRQRRSSWCPVCRRRWSPWTECHALAFRPHSARRSEWGWPRESPPPTEQLGTGGSAFPVQSRFIFKLKPTHLRPGCLVQHK